MWVLSTKAKDLCLFLRLFEKIPLTVKTGQNSHVCSVMSCFPSHFHQSFFSLFLHTIRMEIIIKAEL